MKKSNLREKEKFLYSEKCKLQDYQEKIDALQELEKTHFLVIDNTEDEYADRNFYKCYTCDFFEYLGSSYPVTAQCNFYPAFSKAKEESDECHIVNLPIRDFYNLLITQIIEKVISKQNIQQLNREIYELKK